MTARLTDVTTRRPLTPTGRAWAAWIGVLLMLLLIAAAVVLHSPWLSVREIEVAGADRVDASAHLEQAGIGRGAIMIWLDTGAVEEAIASDPWTAEVRAHREWPDRLVVEIRERTESLWVEGQGIWMLVAADGTVVDIAEQPAEGLLRVSIGVRSVSVGVRPDDPLWDELVGLSEALSAPLGAASVLVSDGTELWLETPNHRVRLGHPIDLADKGRVAEVMLADGLPDGATLDVVAPRRPAVVLEGAPEPGVEGSEGEDSPPSVEGEGNGA